MKASPENKVIGSEQVTVSEGEYKDYVINCIDLKPSRREAGLGS